MRLPNLKTRFGIIIVLYFGAAVLLWLSSNVELFGLYERIQGIPPVIGPWLRQPYAHPPLPFVDMAGVLSWRECHLLGVDVTQNNPCDFVERIPANYSPVLWHLPLERLGLHNQIQIALVVGVLFLAVVLNCFKLENNRDVAIASLAAGSPPVFYALERGNLDLIIFLLVVAPLLLSQNLLRWRVLFYLGVLIGAALKFYPVTLLAMIARESLRLCMICLAIAAALVLIMISFNWAFLMQISLPSEQLIGMFGSRILAKGLQEHSSLSPAVGVGIYLICCVSSFVAMVFVARRIWATRVRSNPLEFSDGLILVGGVLIVSCFFAGLNIYYRAIFLVPVVAGVLEKLGTATTTHMRRFYRYAVAITLICLYSDMMRALGMGIVRPGIIEPSSETARSLFMAIFVGKELIWWGEVTILGGLLLSLVYAFRSVSEIMSEFRMALGAKRTTS